MSDVVSSVTLIGGSWDAHKLPYPIPHEVPLFELSGSLSLEMRGELGIEERYTKRHLVHELAGIRHIFIFFAIESMGDIEAINQLFIHYRRK